jgi:hypothetical protein
VGGLSLSLRATPDEVVGSLTHLMGGAANKLKVLRALTDASFKSRSSSTDSS